MLNELRAQNFKSWPDTGSIQLAPLTGLFGTNSSGKTAILQLLLMLKQTVEARDRQQILALGDERSDIALGRFRDLLHKGEDRPNLNLSIGWTLRNNLEILDPEGEPDRLLFSIPQLNFEVDIEEKDPLKVVRQFAYQFKQDDRACRFGMELNSTSEPQNSLKYNLIAEGYEVRRFRGRVWPLPAPIKNYGFPDKVNNYYQNASFLSDLVLAFEECFKNIYYLGPLREYPRRNYAWSGDRPVDVGSRGEFTIAAILASRWRDRESSIEKDIAQKLREIGLIYDFKIEAIQSDRGSYQVWVRRSPNTPEVLITDVGFGVSQILPVLVLCYYVPEGSTIILEHPEIHLHPFAQAGLADVFIDVINRRKVQIILESHSEHLLRRLQRRIAEEVFSHEQTCLYFCQLDDRGQSHLQSLQLDEFGNIMNWPQDFFGDEMGELAAKTEAEMRRRMEAKV
ncbi:AAA family ATPase [Oxynema aestuarii]|uniref:DUF3696 domain-containing protein n=1 Tax=Oxynema aestuarii AP17 TaxID=2064643 RepID=A0A6H1U4V5_9CYAN|nr:DUF3696 domain-containing protein [Oxynema aestuarii]QIZ73456.1 DUF3696 domain-containing protein [Oxynema aestuarii AP17]